MVLANIRRPLSSWRVEGVDYATTEAGYKNPQERVASAATSAEPLFATVRQIGICQSVENLLFVL